MLLLFTITIFLGAALLFFVQPLIAKMVLPLLGGSPAVWNTCMVFFQAALLAGYAYAHWSVRLLGTRRQAILHGLLVLIPLSVLPIALRGGEPPGEGSPIPWLLAALAVTIGLPFTVAATGGPLLQRWFAATGHQGARDPYFLYAASNAGSLLALLAYPFVVEPLITVTQQRWLWSGGYVVFALLTIACGLIVARAGGASLPPAAAVLSIPPASTLAEPATGASQVWKERLLWIGLAFIPSSLMLGVTQYISTDIAAVPLLWVVPLSIYLLTFIIAFARFQFVSTPWLSRIMPLLVVALVVAFLTNAASPMLLLIALHLAVFFVGAQLCHLRLAQSRPHPSRLTEFYLLIAVGGVLGGVFNALLAPLIFNTIAEYPIAIALACLARRAGGDFWQRRPSWVRHAADFGSPLLLGILAVSGYTIAQSAIGVHQSMVVFHVEAAIILAIAIPAFGLYLLSGRRVGFALAAMALLWAALYQEATAGGVVYRERTFYGVHKVKHSAAFIELVHSETAHGIQARDPEARMIPLAYYSPHGPIGHVYEVFLGSPLFNRIGLVGLGSGALVAYGQPGQHITFHEIDPAIVRIAQTHFTYLSDTPAKWDVLLGDGRKTLQRLPDGEYGLLVLDAFSADAIPVHLMTREAVELYMDKLKPGGILAFHISNRYLKLWPVLERIASELGLASIQRADDVNPETSRLTGVYASHWVLMAREYEDFGPLLRDIRWHRPSPHPRGPLWTDDFSNILSIFIPS